MLKAFVLVSSCAMLAAMIVNVVVGATVLLRSWESRDERIRRGYGSLGWVVWGLSSILLAVYIGRGICLRTSFDNQDPAWSLSPTGVFCLIVTLAAIVSRIIANTILWKQDEADNERLRAEWIRQGSRDVSAT